MREPLVWLVQFLALPVALLALVAFVHAGAELQQSHDHAMPCPPHVQPNLLHVSWSAAPVDSTIGPSHGSKTITHSSTVRKLYSSVCSVRLIKYNHRVAFSCPAAFGSATYHLAFLRGGRRLLRVTEDSAGCLFISVDGRPDLGIALLGGLILPKGVPADP